MEPVDLLQAFTSFVDNRYALEKLMSVLMDADPAIAVLALEGLYRIERDIDSRQFISLDSLRVLLRRWRCESPLSQAYSGAYGRAPDFLRSLTIFKTLEVPLFIDNYGQKELLRNYYGRTEDIQIDGNTPIFHDTHSEEAKRILYEQRLKPSDNKNIIEGCWFGLDNSSNSVYGSKSFVTTLFRLGVTGLHQGEIVSYKDEVNVILYAGDDTTFEGLKKPTDKAVRKANPGAYAKVSIFVPARFLPSQDNFCQVFSGPYEVKHGPFCVKAKRSREPCAELESGQLPALLHQLDHLELR